MDVDDDLDLFGDAEEDTDHFFLPEHYEKQDESGFDAALPLDLPIEAQDRGVGVKNREGIDLDSLASDGLSDDEELPEEEEAQNPGEDIDYEDLIAQAQRNLDNETGEPGQDVHMPDLGGLPAGASGAMARWMAGVEESDNVDNGEGGEFRDSMSREEILREYFPSFKSDKTLDFSDLFSTRAHRHHSIGGRKAKQLVPKKLQLDLEIAATGLFRSSIRRQPQLRHKRRPGIIDTRYTDDDGSRTSQSRMKRNADDLEKNDFEIIMACEEWDFANSPRTSEDEAELPATTVKLPKLHFLNDNHELWMNEDIFDGSYISNVVTLNMNDPRLYIHEGIDNAKPVARKSIKQKQYNFSNDDAYALLQATHQSRIRSNLAQLSLEHAGFTDRLQSPYYKTTLSKSEARAYHRPAMIFKPGQEIRFSRVRARKKKDKDRSKDPKVLFKQTKDISLADNAGFVCLEYSEEYPTILSNAGMASKIVNYYRKRSEEDESRPTGTYGEASILGDGDQPFWNFGSVEPGETTQTIYNRMYRAPIFKHTPNETDFLMVKSSTKLGNRFYLRSLKHFFVVGQTLPAVDIPGPHSRKVTTSYKNRLKMITYRLIRKDDNQRLLVKDLMKHFPDQNEMQIRQRLKDFMEFQRKGEDQNFWKLKAGDILPSEEVTRAMIDAETVCLIESMQVGQRHLEDSGYGKAADGDDEPEENMSVEQQLAPWISTRNFINATQGKAMLQLYGEGDPTGRGEGLSFIRTSMKGGFKVAGESVNDTLDHEKTTAKGAHSYNVAEQQKAYANEIARIWRAQKTSLSMTDGQVLDRDALENNGDLEGESPFSEVAATPSANSEQDDDLMSVNSAMSASNLNKVLKVTRITRNSSGELVSNTEHVRDPHVIHAYITKRRAAEDEDINLEGASLERTDDEERNKKIKKKLEDDLLKLKRNADRRQARKAQKAAGTLKPRTKKAKAEAAAAAT